MGYDKYGGEGEKKAEACRLKPEDAKRKAEEEQRAWRMRLLHATEKCLDPDEGLRDGWQVKRGENRDDREHAQQLDE